MKKILENYIIKTNELINSLAPLSETTGVFSRVYSLKEEMQKDAMECKDEMLHPTLFNAAATIATAPEGCSVRQLKEALCDAKAEMEMMMEYLE
jgi:hypothetical protein